MPQPLWMSIEPRPREVRLLLTEAAVGTSLKARLPPPAHARALPTLLEALSAWYQQPLRAVLDADAQDVQRHPEQWALWLGDVAGHEVSVEWVGARAKKRRDKFLEAMGDFASARKMITFAATGQR